MARPKKENVERGANGAIKSSSKASYATRLAKKEQADRNAAAVVKWARMKEVMMKLAVDPLLQSPCGQMLLIEHPARLNAAEMAAAERLLEILNDYDVIVLGVRRSAQAQDIVSVKGGNLGAGPSPEAVKRASDKFMEAEGILGRAGPGVASAAKALVRDEDWRHRLDNAVAGLKALAREWGLREVPEPKIKRAIEAAFRGAA